MLVGRETELSRIESLLSRARSSRGGALALVGEAGIGKTALLGEARSRADGMRVVATVGVESEADLPFAALGELVAPFLDRRAELPEPQAVAVGAALAIVPAGAAPGDRLAIFAGFMGLLVLAAAREPLLILVDDAQWLDSASADCLGYLARRVERAPIALLVAAREEGDRTPPVAETLRLAGLERASALQLLRASARQLARPTAEALVEVTLGNPLALIELPQLLRDEQRRGLAPLDPLPAPAGVLRDALERRLERLPPAARTALVVAAAASDRALAPVVGACADLGIPREALEQAEAEACWRWPTIRSSSRIRCCGRSPTRTRRPPSGAARTARSPAAWRVTRARGISPPLPWDRTRRSQPRWRRRRAGPACAGPTPAPPMRSSAPPEPARIPRRAPAG